MLLTQALRVLRQDPCLQPWRFVLALGIGATSAMFSLADAILLRPLSVLSLELVVTINTAASTPLGLNLPVSYPDYVDLRDRNRTFSGLVLTSNYNYGAMPWARPVRLLSDPEISKISRGGGRERPHYWRSRWTPTSEISKK